MSFFGKIFGSIAKGLGSLFKSGASKLGSVVSSVQKLGQTPVASLAKNIVSSVAKAQPVAQLPQKASVPQEMPDESQGMPAEVQLAPQTYR